MRVEKTKKRLHHISPTGLMPSTDLQQAKADMFSEAVYELENEIVRAIIHPDPEIQVLYGYQQRVYQQRPGHIRRLFPLERRGRGRRRGVGYTGADPGFFL